MNKYLVKSNRSVTSILAVLLWASVLSATIGFAQRVNERESMQNLKDEGVVAALSSQNAEAAHQAVEEIMLRGDRMIPLLLRCKGNSNFFNGYGLGHRSSGFLIPVPAKGKKYNDGSFVTVEVAALYLISSVYHKTTEFAEAPYLTDGSTVQWQRFNTPERVNKAWNSVERWVHALRSEWNLFDRDINRRYQVLRSSSGPDADEGASFLIESEVAAQAAPWSRAHK